MENSNNQPGLISYLIMGIGIIILVFSAWTIKKEILDPQDKPE
jgi:hypothetical protein